MSFLDRIFNKKKQKEEEGIDHPVISLLSNFLEELFSITEWNLYFDIESNEDMSEIFVDFDGDDKAILLEKEGQLLDAIQFFCKRMIQYRLPEDRILLTIDCDGFREDFDNSLRSLADKLKDVAIRKSKPVYFRALSSRDRRIIHQHLSKDQRVQSRSIGEGLYKKIKIFPVEGSMNNPSPSPRPSAESHP